MKRDPRLDFLRFVAIWLVLGSHLLTPVSGLAALWARGGWVGVDVFFVLSGFLVARLLLEEYRQKGRADAGRFLIRRGFKIYPAFYFYTAVATAVILAEGGFSWARLASQVFFVQNYTLGTWTQPFIDQHEWTLAVEEHFYFLLAFAVWLLLKGEKAHWFPELCILSVPLCLGLRVHYGLNHAVTGFGPSLVWTHFRLDSLFFGALLAYAYTFHREDFLRLAARHRAALAACAAAGFLPFFLLDRAAHPDLLITLGQSLLYLSSGCLLAAALVGPRPPAALAFLGRHSYGIYLWHLLVRYAVWKWNLHLGLYLVLSIVVGVATSMLVEVPFLKLRDRFFPSRAEGRPA